MVSVALFSSPDFEAEFLNTTAYIKNALVLEYFFILVLLISEEKRSALSNVIPFSILLATLSLSLLAKRR